MSLGTGLESGILSQSQVGDFASPAESENAPRRISAASGFLVGVCKNARDLGEGCWGSSLGLEEVAELRFVLIGLWRVPRDVGGFALEEVGDVDAVFPLFVSGSEDISSLEGLGEEAEDICCIVRFCRRFLFVEL